MEDIEKLSSIVRALLLLSQAESGQLVLQKAPLDLGEVVTDLVDQFQQLWLRPGRHQDTPEADLFVSGRQAQIAVPDQEQDDQRDQPVQCTDQRTNRH